MVYKIIQQSKNKLISHPLQKKTQYSTASQQSCNKLLNSQYHTSTEKVLKYISRTEK
jgi:hypothetical protein